MIRRFQTRALASHGKWAQRKLTTHPEQNGHQDIIARPNGSESETDELALLFRKLFQQYTPSLSEESSHKFVSCRHAWGHPPPSNP